MLDRDGEAKPFQEGPDLGDPVFDVVYLDRELPDDRPVFRRDAVQDVQFGPFNVDLQQVDAIDALRADPGRQRQDRHQVLLGGEPARQQAVYRLGEVLARVAA